RDVQALRDLLEFYLRAPGIAGGDVRKAEAMAQQIAGLDTCEGLLAKAHVAEFRKDLKGTEAVLRRAADACRSSYKSLLAAAELLVGNRGEEWKAEALAKAAITLDRDRVQAYSTLAAIYAGPPDWRELDALLLSAPEAVPDDLTPYYRAAERLLSDSRD